MPYDVRKKKLIEAVTDWLSRATADNDENVDYLAHDLESWGLESKQLSQLSESTAMVEHDQFELWPCNLAAMEALNVIHTQLSFSPRNLLLGFNYSAVEAGLRMARITITKELFAQLKIIESVLINYSTQ